MTDEQKRELKRRANFILASRVPASITGGSAVAAAQYRDDVAVLATYVRRGIGAEKCALACSRVEGRSAAAKVLACDAPQAAGPAVHTPSSNTGVNEVSGSGRGLQRGYTKAAQSIFKNWTRLETSC